MSAPAYCRQEPLKLSAAVQDLNRKDSDPREEQNPVQRAEQLSFLGSSSVSLVPNSTEEPAEQTKTYDPNAYQEQYDRSFLGPAIG